jgi:hypothetical protein
MHDLLQNLQFRLAWTVGIIVLIVGGAIVFYQLLDSQQQILVVVPLVLLIVGITSLRIMIQFICY